MLSVACDRRLQTDCDPVTRRRSVVVRGEQEPPGEKNGPAPRVHYAPALPGASGDCSRHARRIDAGPMTSRSRLIALVASILNPLVWLHGLRILHFYAYSHVSERRKMRLGPGVRLAPNISIRNGERISVGAGAEVGERCSLWAGDSTGRITIGESALFGPDVYVTASNYAFEEPGPVMDQPKHESDVLIGPDTWLGKGVIVLPGTTIGAGCVVGAGSVVSRSLPPWSVAVGSPARVVRQRPRQHGSAENPRPAHP